jgi:hypothetical protein
VALYATFYSSDDFALGQIHNVVVWRSKYFATFYVPRMVVMKIQVLWNITYWLDKFRYTELQFCLLFGMGVKLGHSHVGRNVG